MTQKLKCNVTINVKFTRNHEKTCPNESNAGARIEIFLSLPQSSHFSSLHLWFLPPTHPHSPKSKCQFVGRPLSSLCSPLTVPHISSYRSIPPSCYRATHNSLHYSAYCRHTYVHVRTNPHTPRHSQEDDRMCKYTTWKHAQTQMPANFSIKHHAPVAYPGCSAGFHFIHLCHCFKYSWAAHMYIMVTDGSRSSKT